MRNSLLVPAKYFEPDAEAFRQRMIAACCSMVSTCRNESFRPLMSSGDSYSMDPNGNDWWIHFRTPAYDESIPEGFVRVSVHYRYTFPEGVDAVITLLMYRYGLEKYNPKI